MKTLSKLNIFLIALGTSSVLMLFAFFYYQAETKEIVKDKHDFLNAVTELKLEQLLQWKKERNADAIFFPTIGQFIKHTDYLNTKQNVNKATEYFSKTLKQFVANGYDENIVISNLTGEVLFTVDDRFSQFDDDRFNEIKKAIDLDSVIFGDFYFDSLKNKPLINIISLIKDNYNIPFAVFIQQVDPNKSLISVIQKWPTASKTAETLLFKREKDSIVYLNELRHLKNSALRLKIPISQTDVVAVKGILGKRGIIEGKDYRGVEVLAELKSVPGTDWYLVSKIDKEELFSEIFYRAEVLFIVVLLSILFITAVALYFYKLQQSRIYKNLFFKQKELSETQEEYKTALYSIGDGVITTDTHGFIKQMNPVAEKLTGWKEKEAKGLILNQVFNIVNEETGKNVENPVEFVLRKGMVVGLANHTLLIRKDGKKLPIADSGSPIRDLDNKIIGVILVFRDQSDERAKEKSIQESEERFRKAFTTSPDSVNINKLSNGMYVSVNNGFLKLTGYSEKEVIGKTSYEINIWADISDRDELVKRLNQYSVVENFEARFKIKSGEVKDGLMSAAILELNNEKHIISITRDISERKRTELLIKNSEANLTSLINNRNESIWSIDRNYNFIVFNNFFKDSYFEAYNKKLGIGLNSLEILTPELKDFWKPKYDKALKGEKIVFEFSSQVGNQYKYFEIYLNPILVGGSITGVSALSVDISDRKNAENFLREKLALEEQISKIVKTAPGGLCSFKLFNNGKVSMPYVSDAWCEMFDLKQEDVFDDASVIFKKIHPDDVEHVNKTIQESAQQMTDWQDDFRIINKKRGVVWVSGHSTPKLEVDGTIIWHGFITDITERKQTEQALLENQIRVESIIKNAPIILFVLDLDGIFTFSEGKGLDSLGLKPGEVVGLSAFEMYKEFPTVVSSIRKALQGEINSAIHDMGKWIFDVFYMPLKNEDGKIKGLIGVATDITDSKKAERALRSSEERLRLSLNAANQGLYDLNIQTGEAIVNDEYALMLGYDPKLFKETNSLWIERLHPDDREITSKAFIDYVSGKTSEYRVEFRQKTSDGQWMWILSMGKIVEYDSVGKPLRMLGTHTNINERKLAEEGLREKEETYRLTAEQTGEIIYDHNMITGSTKWSGAIEQITGYSPEEFRSSIANDIFSHINPEDRERIRAMCNQSAQQGLNYQVEYKFRKKDGNYIYLEDNAAFIKDNDGKVARMLGTLIDVTEKKKLFDDLKEAKEKAEEMNRVKAFFYANMSHELRTPFVGIMGFSEILAGSLKDDEEREMAEQILKSSKRLTDTLNKILNVTRLEFDKVELSNVEFDVCELINNIQSFYSSSAKLKNTTITTALQHPHMTFKSDPRLLEDILNNLVSNSIKFTEGGNINLSADIELLDEKKILTIKVKDTGIGIPKDKQNLVWFEFRQASEGLNRSFEGTGLGLTITKKYVEILGGEITLESEANIGTTFTIKLPMNDAYIKTSVQEEKSSDKIKVEPKIHTDKKYKVLYVEDDMIALNYISIVLKSLYDITTAFNAKIAIELVNKDRFDVLMLDINLGRGMDGVELMQQIRRMENYKETPIVAVTAYAAQSDREEFLAKGFSHYISKPFTSTELKNLLSSLFNINSA